MAWVFSEVLSPINDVPFASEIVDTMRDTLCIDVFLSTGSEVLFFLETERVLYAFFEHGTGLLTEDRVLIVIRLEILLPGALDIGSHACRRAYL